MLFSQFAIFLSSKKLRKYGESFPLSCLNKQRYSDTILHLEDTTSTINNWFVPILSTQIPSLWKCEVTSIRHFLLWNKKSKIRFPLLYYSAKFVSQILMRQTPPHWHLPLNAACQFCHIHWLIFPLTQWRSVSVITSYFTLSQLND